MPLHDCTHTFEALATTVLPEHMQRMRTALASPMDLATFAAERAGVSTLLKTFGRPPEDFSGCYVLVEQEAPIYVGISRNVFGRLRQHVRGKTHFDASLAFRIARQRHDPDGLLGKLTRKQAMAIPEFSVAFAEAQHYLRSLRVATIPIPNPLELYVFEVYCAIELDTHQWNSFRTH